MTVLYADAVPDRTWEEFRALRRAFRMDPLDQHRAEVTRAIPSERSRSWAPERQYDPYREAQLGFEDSSLGFESRDLMNLVRRLDALAHPSAGSLGDVITLNEAAVLRRILLAHARATSTRHEVKTARRTPGYLALVGAALIAIAAAAYGVSLHKGAVSGKPVPMSEHMAPFGAVWDDIYLARPLSDTRRLPLFLNRWDFAITDITSSAESRQ